MVNKARRLMFLLFMLSINTLYSMENSAVSKMKKTAQEISNFLKRKYESDENDTPEEKALKRFRRGVKDVDPLEVRVALENLRTLHRLIPYSYENSIECEEDFYFQKYWKHFPDIDMLILEDAFFRCKNYSKFDVLLKRLNENKGIKDKEYFDRSIEVVVKRVLCNQSVIPIHLNYTMVTSLPVMKSVIKYGKSISKKNWESILKMCGCDVIYMLIAVGQVPPKECLNQQSIKSFPLITLSPRDILAKLEEKEYLDKFGELALECRRIAGYRNKINMRAENSFDDVEIYFKN